MSPPAATLDPAQRAFVSAARRATLATIAPDGRPRLVPVCFVLAPVDDASAGPRLWTPLDEKPKQNPDPLALARVRDLLARPRAALLVDRWDEDWTRLAWVRLDAAATLVEPDVEPGEHALAVAELRAKYPQYATHDLQTRPVIRLTVERVATWGSLAP